MTKTFDQIVQQVFEIANQQAEDPIATWALTEVQLGLLANAADDPQGKLNSWLIGEYKTVTASVMDANVLVGRGLMRTEGRRLCQQAYYITEAGREALQKVIAEASPGESASHPIQEQGNIEGLAKHLANTYGPADEGFFTRCMDASELADYPEENRKRICTRAHKEFIGKWPSEEATRPVTELFQFNWQFTFPNTNTVQLPDIGVDARVEYMPGGWEAVINWQGRQFLSHSGFSTDVEGKQWVQDRISELNWTESFRPVRAATMTLGQVLTVYGSGTDLTDKQVVYWDEMDQEHQVVRVEGNVGDPELTVVIKGPQPGGFAVRQIAEPDWQVTVGEAVWPGVKQRTREAMDEMWVAHVHDAFTSGTGRSLYDVTPDVDFLPYDTYYYEHYTPEEAARDLAKRLNVPFLSVTRPVHATRSNLLEYISGGQWYPPQELVEQIKDWMRQHHAEALLGNMPSVTVLSDLATQEFMVSSIREIMLVMDQLAAEVFAEKGITTYEMMEESHRLTRGADIGDDLKWIDTFYQLFAEKTGKSFDDPSIPYVDLLPYYSTGVTPEEAIADIARKFGLPLLSARRPTREGIGNSGEPLNEPDWIARTYEAFFEMTGKSLDDPLVPYVDLRQYFNTNYTPKATATEIAKKFGFVLQGAMRPIHEGNFASYPPDVQQAVRNVAIEDLGYAQKSPYGEHMVVNTKRGVIDILWNADTQTYKIMAQGQELYNGPEEGAILALCDLYDVVGY